MIQNKFRRHNLKKYYLMIVMAGFFTSFIYSGIDIVGTTSMNFVKVEPFARSAGMGEAFTAVADGTYGIYYNPAGLTSVLGYEAQFTHIGWFQNINYELMSIVTPSPFTDPGKLGMALAWFRIGQMNGTSALTDAQLNNLGGVDFNTPEFNKTFSPYDYAVYLAYGLDISDNFSAGLSVKMTSQNIDTYSGMNLTEDLGLIYMLTLNGQYLRAGLDINNIFSPTLTMNTSSFESPWLVNIGISDQFALWKGTGLAAAQAIVQQDYDTQFAIGAEYWFYDMFALRAGYKFGAFNQPTFGCGAKYDDFEVDYAFIAYDQLGNTNRLSLLYSWGSPPVKLRVYPYVFSPNGDKYMDVTYFFPSLKSLKDVKSLKLNIYDTAGGNILDTFPEDKNVKSFRWDGTAKGVVLPDSVYQASITAEYGGGTSESNRVAVEIDNTPPDMRLDANPKILKLNDSNRLLIPATFTFYAHDRNRVVQWQFTIWDYNKKIFFTMNGKGEPPQDFIWDGKGNDGQVVNTGEVYYYSFSSWDSVGNRGTTKPEAVVVLLKEIKLTFSADALFDPGRANVKISAYSLLKGIKNILTHNPESMITVAGYTDNIQPGGTRYKNNIELSKARAEAVKFFMVNLLGYNEKKISTVGYGEANPIAPNDTEEGRLKNRRVEMMIQSTIYK
jgi:chemotaxis protein MotB